ncbi:hypothetical protein BH11MYX4_BH11MYX4_60670 [soil metagenome]
MNIRRGLLLTQLSLSLAVQPLLSCRGDDDPSAGPPSTSPSAHLDGETCALVGNAARLRVGATEPRAGSAQGSKALPFLVESTGCAPACTAVMGEGEIVEVRSAAGGAATVQVVIIVDGGASSLVKVTASHVVHFLREGECQVDAAAAADAGESRSGGDAADAPE